MAFTRQLHGPLSEHGRDYANATPTSRVYNTLGHHLTPSLDLSVYHHYDACMSYFREIDNNMLSSVPTGLFVNLPVLEEL